MGFESFNLQLRGGPATATEAAGVISRIAGVSRDECAIKMPGSHYYLLRDVRHAIEIEMREKPVSISLRFTLCHPSSVDNQLLDLARTLMRSLGMSAIICDDVAPEHAGDYSLERFDDLAGAVRHTIGIRRGEWRATFGDEELGATTAEAHRHFILPQCQPAIAKVG